MRNLEATEVNKISGGYIGEVITYDFDLRAGVEVVGFERIEVGYDEFEFVERGLWKDVVTVIQKPLYEYYPIYDHTVTYVF